MGSEALSVRLLLDARPEDVGEALARSLLSGQPPLLKAAGGWPMLAAPSGLLMPWPISREWQEATAHLPVMMNPEKVFSNGVGLQERSFSLGLRPLRKQDIISAGARPQGFRITLKAGFPSQLLSTETTSPPEHGQRALGRSFLVQVSSTLIAAATANIQPETLSTVSLGDDLGHSSWIAMEVAVRPHSRGRCELLRRLMDRSPLLDAAAFYVPGRGEEHAAHRLLRTIAFMLEMESRAWCECLSFPLVEVWRGARSRQDWAASGNLLTVGSYAFGSGHSGLSVLERRLGPSYDPALARRLSEELPKEPVAEGVAQRQSQSKFIEGNVQVESFAALLDRISGRATQESDIFREFVDLGSGPGLAVLTAHLLFPFRSCVGCELQSRVAKSAREMGRRYMRCGLADSARSSCDTKKLFVEGDFLKDFDWSGASVAFANSVTWPKEMLLAVGTQALQLKRGAVLLLAARQLPTEQVILEAFDVRGEACLMSFSSDAVPLWVYQRQ